MVSRLDKLMLILTLLLVIWGTAVSQSPGKSAIRARWIINERLADNEKLAAIRPEVHSVTVKDRYLEVRSAGTSLHFFGPFQTTPWPVERVRQLRYRIPLEPEIGNGVGGRPDLLGLFLNGVPIYNRFTEQSYDGRNIWHFDSFALEDDGSWFANGRPRRSLAHPISLGVIESLLTDSGHHSPLIGYALDGFPIYGPYGFSGENGRPRRMRSGYRLRRMKRRTELPDGTRLTPAQFGPEVGPDFPLGSFVEDYEFVEGAGDLDRFNCRWAKTPEYPDGTYAYFLATDPTGFPADAPKLAFPYLLTGEYRGAITPDELRAAFVDLAGVSGPGSRVSPLCCEVRSREAQAGFRISLQIDTAKPEAGRAVRLSFRIDSPAGAPISHLEYLHERPLHLMIVSEDLTKFAHIHPEASPGKRYEVEYKFPHPGRYLLYADFSPPGGSSRVISFPVQIRDAAHEPSVSKNGLGESAQVAADHLDLEVDLARKGELRAGEDISLSFKLRGSAAAQIEPYLGAWAHFVAIDPGHRSFIHAHPAKEVTGPNSSPLAENQEHLHQSAPAPTGPRPDLPPPDQVDTIISFPHSGRYRLWAQFQVVGKTVVRPFELRIGPAVRRKRIASPLVAGAIPVKVSSSGFSPAEIRVPPGRPVTLAFERDSRPNCASTVLFPALGLRRELPLGVTTLVELPPLTGGELVFTCGMGMYKGLILQERRER